MSVQDAVSQLLQVGQNQEKLESQIKQFQTVLSTLQGENWRTHFTGQLTTIKGQVSAMEKLLKRRKGENEKLKQERDLAQQTVDELTVQLRESQKPQTQPKKKVGGTMSIEINDNIKSIAANIKEEVLKKAKLDSECKIDSFEEFTPIQARSQVVAGINWYIKIRTAKSAFIHVKVWAKLNKEYELSGVLWNKAETDALDGF
eukprot:29367_1